MSSQNINSQITSSSSYNTITNILPNIKEKINLVTHNVRGFNNYIKRQQWITYCLQKNFHIISITETKLKESSQISLTNPYYKIYTSNYTPILQQREASLGTAIMVHNTVQPYIHNINAFLGTALCIDFFFPNNKTRIISVYLPSNNSDLSKRTQTQISLWSTEAKNKNWHIIILGDFNSNNYNNKKKNTIFTDLTTNNCNSLLNFHNITTPTWNRNNSYSQIDDIWVSTDILLDTEIPNITSAIGITESDHSIISTTWVTNFSSHCPRNKKKKRKIYLYDRMTNENWEEFSNKIQQNFTLMSNQEPITDTKSLNRNWHIWSSKIIQVANQLIPTTHTVPKPFYALSLKASKLHSALKHINKCLHTLTTISPPLSIDYLIPILNKHLSRATILMGTPNSPLNQLSISSEIRDNTQISHYRYTLKIIKDLKTIIWKSRNTEKNIEQSERIKYYVNRRYTDFKDNTSRMINSILHQQKDRISFEKIISPDSVITEPQQIKEATRAHFQNWTKSNPTDNSLWEEWKGYYAPNKKINSSTYQPLIQQITLEELNLTIKEAPKYKATGPLMISNEMLQHLPSSAISYLLCIFNACLLLEQIPNQWLKSNIWPIPKKAQYTYELNTTRPITLIDHTRKIFTKIITNRLSNILDRNDILSPLNYAAFPGQSTLQLISQLTSIIEHSLTTQQEIWLLLQDMSKAFDSIHIPTLTKAFHRIKLPIPIINLLIFLLSNRTNQVITDYGSD